MTRSLQKEIPVVEDEPIVRMVVADALADEGIIAWEAGDAEEALEALVHHPLIGVLFTDVNMPGEMNGLELAEEVDKVRPEVGLIVTSGAMSLSDDELPDHGTFIAKPYRAERLIALVAEKFRQPCGPSD